MNRRAARLACVALVAGLVASGCRLEVGLNVEVAEDGSGRVELVATLDDEALARVGGDLASILTLDDLRAAGWTVDGPDRAAGGETTVRVHRPFDDPEDAAAAFAELGGDDGPFRDLAVEHERSFWRDRWRFTGRIDLDRGLADRGEALYDEAVDALREQLGASLSRVLQVRVGVRLPGDVRSNATTKADNGAVWQLAFGGDPIELDAAGTRARPWSYVLVGAGALLLLVAGIVLLIRLAIRQTDRAAP